MKLRLPVFIITTILIATIMSSCTHDYICHCTIKYTGQPGLPDSSVKEFTITDKHNKAKSSCEGNSGSWTTDGVTKTETCVLY